MPGSQLPLRLSLLLFVLVLAGCGSDSGSSSSSVNYAVECAAPRPLNFVEPPVSGPRISGQIDIEANARVDKDSAELLAEFDQPRLSQPEQLPSAVILGGYISASAGEYEEAPFEDERPPRYPADPQDRYCIDLEPGQAVDVAFFGPDTGYRLRLVRALDAQEVAVADADGTDTLRVTLPNDAVRDRYVVDIQATAAGGPARYVLTSSPTAHARNLDWPKHEFISGEALVLLEETAQDGTASSVRAASTGSGLNMDRPLGAGIHKVTMPTAVLGARYQAASNPEQETIDWIRLLRDRSDVVSASPNYVVRAMAAFSGVSEPLYPSQWHYPLINVPQAWQLVPGGGNDVSVAVLDTGLFRDAQGWHEDLVGSLACNPRTCWDFVDDDNDPRDPASTLGGSVFHGTHVAGTIAASATNGLGGTGIAPDSMILPARVLDENGSGDLAAVIEAINWATANHADVINLSLGTSANPPELQKAVISAIAEDVLIVAAAGNSPTTERAYPAALDGVFGVGAVDAAGVRASYSSRGPGVTLVAPGGDAGRDANQDGRADVVVSASGDPDTGSTYAGLQGTSMAAPHVAGVFALMKQLNRNLNASTINASLSEITSGRTDPGYGAGLIDAARAVELASAGPLSLLSAEPTLLEFDRETAEHALILKQIGDGGGQISAASVQLQPGAPWLQVGSLAEAEDGFTVPVRVDLDALPTGRAHRSEITVTYTSDGQQRQFEVPVIVPVSSAVAERQAGLHFVLMVAEDKNMSAQTALSAIDGTYSFNFGVTDSVTGKAPNEVVAGQSYYLVAGTDLDNDGFLCTAGEACAEYPVAGLRERVKVLLEDGQVRLVDTEGQTISSEALVMTTSFSRPLSAQSLPRPGFEGYKLLESPPDYAPRAVAE